MKFPLIIITASLLMGGCRTIQKDSAKLEASSAHKSSVQEAYERAIVTEYIEIPIERIIERPGQIIRDTLPAPPPKIIRQIVYEKGSRQQEAEAQTQIEAEGKAVEKKSQPSWAWIAAGGAGLLLFFILMLVFLLYRRVAP